MADQDHIPHAIDLHVGARVRMRRKLLDMSQDQLAASIGLTFQQVQKYERGANRVSASKLYQIGQALSVPVSFFFEGLDEANDPGEPAVLIDFFNADGALELARTFVDVPVAKRRAFLRFAAAGSDLAKHLTLEPA